MNYTKEYELIKEFQESFSFQVLKLSKENAKTLIFRKTLIEEEWLETISGINGLSVNKHQSLIEIADGLGDLAVVTLGTLYTFNLKLNNSHIFNFYDDEKLSGIKKSLADSYSYFKSTDDNIIGYSLAEKVSNDDFAVINNCINYISDVEFDNCYISNYEQVLNLILFEIQELWSKYLPEISFSEVYSEIHRSNMSKACDTEETALRTIAQPKYKNEDLNYNKKDGKYYVSRADGKLIKSIDYTPANIEDIVYAFNRYVLTDFNTLQYDMQYVKIKIDELNKKIHDEYFVRNNTFNEMNNTNFFNIEILEKYYKKEYGLNCYTHIIKNLELKDGIVYGDVKFISKLDTEKRNNLKFVFKPTFEFLKVDGKIVENEVFSWNLNY